MTEGLAASLLGHSPLQLLRFLGLTFLPMLRAQSRIRELAADAVGARIATPRDQAHALVRIHVLDEAFVARWEGATATAPDAPDRAALVQTALRRRLADVAAETLFQSPEFWPRLFSRSTPHPLDTHPPLSERLHALDVQIDPGTARHLFDTPLAEEHAAVALIGAARTKLDLAAAALGQRLAEVADHGAVVVAVRAADPATPAGRALLEKHFPTREWATRQGRLITATIVLGAAAAGFLAGAGFLLTVSPWPALMCLAGAAIFGLWASTLWIRHRSALLRLECDRVTYSSWSRPILFAEVAQLSWGVQDDRVTLTMHMKRPTEPPGRMVILRGPKTKLVIPLSFVAGQVDVANVILKYWQRVV